MKARKMRVPGPGRRSLKRSLWGTLKLTLNFGQNVSVPYITRGRGWLNVVECGKHRFNILQRMYCFDCV